MVMRVAQVTPVYPPYRGGIGAVAAEYARGLTVHGVDVTVFTPEYKKHAATGSDNGVVRLRPWYAWGNAALVPSLFRALRRFDIIHLHYPFYGGEVFALLASLCWRIPLVVTYHMKPKAAGWLGAIFRLHRLLLEPLIFWRAKAILVSSREYAIETGVLNETAISEMPFGVDTARFAPGRDDEFRARAGIDPAAAVVLFVGGLDDAHYFKGLSVLLHAMVQTDAHLLVVGDGNRRPLYQEEALTLGIAERVHFAGSVDFSELPRAYRAADVHVLPSIDRSEAFGLVTLEAMASGIPSVVSDLPGMRSLLVPGETGLLSTPGDADALAGALQKLLQHSERRTSMGQAARVRAVAQYDADAVLVRLLQIYQSFVSSL